MDVKVVSSILDGVINSIALRIYAHIHDGFQKQNCANRTFNFLVLLLKEYPHNKL